MQLIRLTILLFFLMGIFSCTNKEIKKDDIDKFISKYQNEPFTNFVDVSITFKDSDFGSDIYMVAKQGGKCPPYIIHFNKRLKEVTSIDKKLLKQRNFNDYFDENYIKLLMKEFIEFDFKTLSVDSSKNVFINPFIANEPAYFLRLEKGTGDSVIKKGYVYRLYKDNWYLNTNN